MAEDGSMTLTGHLKELRNRLIICAVVFVVGVVVSLAYADRLIDLLTAILGIADHPVTGTRAGCATCHLKETCSFRKRGTTCFTQD
jgi:Sec-independent protein secretion pathway component TatC